MRRQSHIKVYWYGYNCTPVYHNLATFDPLRNRCVVLCKDKCAGCGQVHTPGFTIGAWLSHGPATT